MLEPSRGPRRKFLRSVTSIDLDLDAVLECEKRSTRTTQPGVYVRRRHCEAVFSDVQRSDSAGKALIRWKRYYAEVWQGLARDVSRIHDKPTGSTGQSNSIPRRIETAAARQTDLV